MLLRMFFQKETLGELQKSALSDIFFATSLFIDKSLQFKH